MEIDFLDDMRFERRKIYVPEHIVGIKGAIKTFFYKNSIGTIVRNHIITENYRFPEALKSDIKEKRVVLFSKRAQKVLMKILKEGKMDSLTNRESFVFALDVVFPIVYEENELHNDSFIYYWIISSSENIWHDFSDELKIKIWHLIYPDKEYIKRELDEEQVLQRELGKHPEVKPYLVPMGDASVTLKELLKYRVTLTPRLWGYCLRSFYMCNTFGIPTEMLHAAFDGVSREDLMLKEELSEFEKLPEYITIFRGTDADEKSPRLSWSLDKAYAAKFDHGSFFTARIPKNQVLAYFVNCEQEILAWVDVSQLI